MKPRERVKQAHQLSVIADFINWLNKEKKSNYKIVETPDPPDAILCDNGNYLWIEHADIYRSQDEARAERSAAIPEEITHERKEHPIIEPDQRTATAFISILKDKLSKASYSELHDRYGQGILILTERDPLFSESTFNCITDNLRRCSIYDDKRYFKAVYLGHRSMGGIAFIEIEYRNSEQSAPGDAVKTAFWF